MRASEKKQEEAVVISRFFGQEFLANRTLFGYTGEKEEQRNLPLTAPRLCGAPGDREEQNHGTAGL